MASERTKGDAFSSYQPGWSNLPGGPASLILDELFKLVDSVHFAVVCKEWCSLAKHYYHTTQRWRPNKVLPMLLIPAGFKEVHNTTTKGKIFPSSLYSISERRVCIKNLESPVLPHGTNRLVFGCSHGWVAALDEHRDVIILVNPFRKSVAPIVLPPLPTGTIFHLEKVIMSTDPALDRNSCVLVAKFYIAGYWVASLKLSEEQDQEKQRWSHIPVAFSPSDIMFYKSRLYLCYLDGSLTSIGDVSNNFSASCLYAPLPEPLFIHGSYLVESTKGDLWHIPRFRSNKTQSFKVFKVVLIETRRNLVMQQVEVKSIGDEALFLGYNSISVLASETSGCQPNTIYQQIEAAKPALWVSPPFNSASLSLCA